MTQRCVKCKILRGKFPVLPITKIHMYRHWINSTSLFPSDPSAQQTGMCANLVKEPILEMNNPFSVGHVISQKKLEEETRGSNRTEAANRSNPDYIMRTLNACRLPNGPKTNCPPHCCDTSPWWPNVLPSWYMEIAQYSSGCGWRTR